MRTPPVNYCISSTSSSNSKDERSHAPVQTARPVCSSTLMFHTGSLCGRRSIPAKLFYTCKSPSVLEECGKNHTKPLSNYSGQVDMSERNSTMALNHQIHVSARGPLFAAATTGGYQTLDCASSRSPPTVPASALLGIGTTRAGIALSVGVSAHLHYCSFLLLWPPQDALGHCDWLLSPTLVMTLAFSWPRPSAPQGHVSLSHY